MALAFAKLTAVKNQPQQFGQLKASLVTITFDSSYPDNGEAVTAGNFGLNKLIAVIPLGFARSSDGSTAVNVTFDATNSKLIAYESATTGVVFPEKGDTESLANYVLDVIALGY